LIELRNATAERFIERNGFARRYQLGKDDQPAPADREVVKPLDRGDTAVLDDADPAAGASVFNRQLLEENHAVRQALQLQVAVFGGVVVQQQHGAGAPGKVLLQRQDLPPVPQGVPREQPHFGQRVEDHARRPHALDDCEHRFHRLAQFDFGRVIERVVILRCRGVGCRKLEQLEPFERPPVRNRNGPKFPGCFRQGDVQARLAALPPLHQKLHRQCGFARAWIALNQVHPIGSEATPEQLIQSGDSG